MARLPARNDFDGWVAQLGTSSRRGTAKEHLLQSGRVALPALRRGLRHPKARVRLQCVNILDRLVDDDTIPHLIAALEDPDPDVCGRALHALACDRCKQNECVPGEDIWVPRALDLLHDPRAGVRARAIDALGNVCARRPDVESALLALAESDPDKGLRDYARHHAERAQRTHRIRAAARP